MYIDRRETVKYSPIAYLASYLTLAIAILQNRVWKELNITFPSSLIKSSLFNIMLVLRLLDASEGHPEKKIHLELGLESRSDRRLSRRLVYFYKIINGFAPEFLSNLLPPQRGEEERRAGRRIKPPFEAPFCRTERYRASFFPFCINEWNNLDENIRNLPSISTFKQAILKFFRPSANSVFRVSNNNGVVLLV